MSENESFPSAEELGHQLAAEQLLARMGLLADVALISEEDDYPAVVRRNMAQRYRSLVGVDPEHRAEFREGLEKIAVSGHMSPEELSSIINAIRNPKKNRQS